MIEWFVLEGTLKSYSSTHPALGRNTFHQTKWLQAPSNLTLNTPRDEAATTPLGILYHQAA